MQVHPPRAAPSTAAACRAAAACAALALAALAGAARAGAQGVRVEVRAADDGSPVPHALVGLRRAGDAPEGAPEADARVPLASAGLAAEGVTGASGRRALAVAPGRYRVEVRRIGQRPFVGPVVTVAGSDTAAVVVRVPRAPVTLAAVEVRGRSACRTRTEPEVLALWEAARTALATSAEARPRAQAAPAVAFERVLDTAGALLGERRTPVAPESDDARVFWATTPAVLETYGFVLGSLDEGAQFYGPDERVLLSDAFARTHCFAPARGGGPRAGWLGVRFTPAPNRRVPEVAGVVWLDSATAEPQRVDFEYRWPALPREARGVAGFAAFTRLAGGELAVGEWRIRVPRVDKERGRLRLLGYREFGGTVAPPARPRVRVAGAVYDSLLGAPLAGALVTRAGAPGVAVSDSLGRFALDSVEAGPGAFVFSHAALDSAGLSDLAAPSDLTGARDSARVALATPSRATVWARVCGALPPAPPARAALITGVVRDAGSGAPVPGGVATVAWTALDTVGRRVTAVPHTRALRADSLGTFRLCGAPADAELEVQAAAERSASGWAVVEVGSRGIASLDLLVPPPAPAAGTAPVATAVAAGVVRDSLGVPRAGARVTVEGVAGVEAVTGADGAFRLAGVPAGTQTLVVRALGYGPQPVTVALRTGASDPVDVTLRRVVRLARVTVRSRARGNAALLAAVAQRRRLGLGVTLDSGFIRLSPQMEGVLRRVPYAAVHTVRGGVPGLFTGSNCPLAVAIDDRLTEWDEVADLPPRDVVAMEVYRRTTQVPARFQGHLVQAARRVPIGGTLPCGLALLWTRAGW